MSGMQDIRRTLRARMIAGLLDEVLMWRAIMRNHAASRVARDEATVAYARKVDALVEELAQIRDEGAIHRLLRRLRDDD